MLTGELLFLSKLNLKNTKFVIILMPRPPSSVSCCFSPHMFYKLKYLNKIHPYKHCSIIVQSYLWLYGYGYDCKLLRVQSIWIKNVWFK